jgi:hypothetical protein
MSGEAFPAFSRASGLFKNPGPSRENGWFNSDFRMSITAARPRRNFTAIPVRLEI